MYDWCPSGSYLTMNAILEECNEREKQSGFSLKEESCQACIVTTIGTWKHMEADQEEVLKRSRVWPFLT